eukprot:398005_1
MMFFDFNSGFKKYSIPNKYLFWYIQDSIEFKHRWIQKQLLKKTFGNRRIMKEIFSKLLNGIISITKQDFYDKYLQPKFAQFSILTQVAEKWINNHRLSANATELVDGEQMTDMLLHMFDLKVMTETWK